MTNKSEFLTLIRKNITDSVAIFWKADKLDLAQENTENQWDITFSDNKSKIRIKITEL